MKKIREKKKQRKELNCPIKKAAENYKNLGMLEADTIKFL